MRVSVRSILLSIIGVLFLTGYGHAADTDFELNINSSDVEAIVHIRPKPQDIPLGFGGGFLYSEDKENYWIASLNVDAVDEVFTPALELGIGLQGLYGKADYPGRDFDIAGLPFMFFAGYDLRKSGLGWPVSFLSHLDYAPSILSFSDTDEYFRFTVNGYFHINYFAAVFLGYRNLNIDFKDGSIRENLADSAAYIGVRFSF